MKADKGMNIESLFKLECRGPDKNPVLIVETRHIAKTNWIHLHPSGRFLLLSKNMQMDKIEIELKNDDRVS